MCSKVLEDGVHSASEILQDCNKTAVEIYFCTTFIGYGLFV
jgi:hypothetical protein